MINKYRLREGENKIKMKIKKRIKDLGNMFYECKNLKNINELKYLNTKYCNKINVCSVDVHHYQILKD